MSENAVTTDDAAMAFTRGKSNAFQTKVSLVSNEALLELDSSPATSNAIVSLAFSNAVTVAGDGDEANRKRSSSSDCREEQHVVFDLFYPVLIESDRSSDCRGNFEETWHNTEGYAAESYFSKCKEMGRVNRDVICDLETGIVRTTSIGQSTRPEFICVKFFKQTKDTRIGIYLKQYARGVDTASGSFGEPRAVRISRIDPNGLMGGLLLSENVLQPGDRVISVNGKSCHYLSARKVKKMLCNAEGTLSIIVHNKHGDPSLVSSSIQKSFPNERVGVWFKNKQGSVVVSRIDAEGLFADTLLLPGHRCLEINGTALSSPEFTTDASDAAQIIVKAPEYVTVVSQPQADFAMVLGCEIYPPPATLHDRWRQGLQLILGAGAGLSSARSLTLDNA